MCELYGYSGTYFFLNNHELLWFFSYYKIIWVFFFFFGRKVSYTDEQKEEKPAMFLPPADKDCYHFAGCCFSTLWAGANELSLKPTSFDKEFWKCQEEVQSSQDLRMELIFVDAILELGSSPLEPGQFFLSSETFAPRSYSRNLNNIGQHSPDALDFSD